MLNYHRLVAIVTAVLAAGPAYGQTPSGTHGTFVDVSFGPAWDDSYSSTSRASGATLATGLTWGFDAGTTGLELNVVVPQWHEKPFPAQRFLYVGQPAGIYQQGHFYESSSTVRRRSIDVMALWRVSQPIHRRVTVTWSIGGGYVFRPERATGVTHEVMPGGQLVEVETRTSTSSRNYLAAATRVDFEIGVSPRVSIVPRLRCTIFPSLLDDSGSAPRMVIPRPEVAVRWRLGR